MSITFIKSARSHRRHHPYQRINRRRESTPLARARVFKRGDTWYFETRTGTRIVDQDNTGHWRTIFDAAYVSATSFDHVLRVGHVVKRSYGELVDNARGGAS